MKLGFRLLEAERWPESRAVLLSVMRQQPKSFAAHLGLAKIARGAGDHLNSLTLSRQAAAIDPGDVGVRLDIAFDLLRLFRFDEAEAGFADVLDRTPAHVGALVGLGHLARRRGNRAEALGHFMAALKTDPTHVEAMLEAAGELTDLGRVEAALPLVDAALLARPNDLNALMQRGHLARVTGDRVLAETWFARAHAVHPGFSSAAVALAEEQRALGRPEIAARMLREVLARDPDCLEAVLSLADQAWLAQDYDRCLALSRRAAQAHPHHVAPPLQATRALMEQGRTTEALALLEPVGEANGWPADLLSRKAEILMAGGAWDAAARVLEAGGQPEDFGLWLHRCRLALTLGGFAEAESLLVDPPVRGPVEQGFASLLRDQLVEARWDHVGARKFYASALAGNPNAARAHAELARISLLLCDLDACRQHTTEALRLDSAVHKLRGQSLNPSSTHVGQIWDEFRMDPPRTAKLRGLLKLAPEARLAPLLAMVRAAPDDLPAAMNLAIALRQSGRLGRVPAPDPDRVIPRRIVQFWDEAQPPVEIAGLMQGWRTMHPDYEHVRLDLDAAGNYLKQSHASAVALAYIRCGMAAQKADIFRLAYLAREGGIYIDADDRCLSHVSGVLLEGASLVAWHEHFGTLGNNFLAAGPGHPVLLRALDLAVTAINRGDEDIPWLATGPGLLTRAFAQALAEAPDLETACAASWCWSRRGSPGWPCSTSSPTTSAPRSTGCAARSAPPLRRTPWTPDGRRRTAPGSPRCGLGNGAGAMVKAVIFDVDGTLIDSVDLHAQAWVDALHDFGFDPPFADVRAQIGKGADQLMPVFLSPGQLAEMGEKLEKHRSEVMKERYLPRIKAFPQVRELFQRLKDDGIQVALASSAKADELEVYKKEAGIEDLLDTETSSDDAQKSKPHPDIFDAALGRLKGIDPADVLVVGDTPYDAEAAAKAGLRTVGVLCGGFPEDGLRAAGCVAIYRDPADLLARYEGSPLTER